ncbi:MAG: Amuc_1099 family pilus-like system protein [Chthoniobacterales bacterium]
MNWIRFHYDRVVVLLGALFLLLCAFFIWRSASDFQENFTNAQTPGVPKPAAPTEKAVEVQTAAANLQKPPQWTFTGRSGLFVPEKHFLGPDNLPATLQTTEIHPPVPNDWLDQFGLPIAEADVLTQDPDGDGFTNLEEWQGKTNPTDKASHPAFIAKLKLKSFNRERFPLIFLAAPGADTFQLNYTDPAASVGADGRPRSETLLANLGKPVLRYDPKLRKDVPTGFRIVDFKQKSQPIGSVEQGLADVSELTLENEKTKEHVVLVKEKPAESPESVGTFVYTWSTPPQELILKKDQEFSLPPDEAIRYKLIDVQPGGAVIVDTQKPDERIEIGLLVP